jgi:hypothetical protein
LKGVVKMNRLEELKNELEVLKNWESENWGSLPEEVKMIIARGLNRTTDIIQYEERKLKDDKR